MAAKKSKTGPCVSLAVWDAFVDGLCHLETTVIADADEAGVSCGTTLWGAENATGQPIQLAWDWREARPGVVAISNPMSIDSNVRLIDALDRPLDLMQRHCPAEQRRLLAFPGKGRS